MKGHYQFGEDLLTLSECVTRKRNFKYKMLLLLLFPFYLLAFFFPLCRQHLSSIYHIKPDIQMNKASPHHPQGLQSTTISINIKKHVESKSGLLPPQQSCGLYIDQCIYCIKWKTKYVYDCWFCQAQMLKINSIAVAFLHSINNETIYHHLRKDMFSEKPHS